MAKSKESGEDLRRSLRAFMDARELEAADWARRAGVSSGTIYNFFAGLSNSLSTPTLQKLAKAENVTVSQLTGDHGMLAASRITTIEMRGSVNAGIWREAVEEPPEDRDRKPIPVPSRYEKTAFGLIVEGPSMNLVYPEGTILVCVDVYDYGGHLRPGNKVIVHRHSPEGTIEATVKELQVDGDGSVWLWPRSSHPAHQQPLPLPRLPDGDLEPLESDGGTILVKAVVVGSYRPEVDVIA